MAESPALKQWVIGKVSYDQEKVLGKGKHAVVYNGMFNWETAVAVKRIQIEFLKNEAILLKKFVTAPSAMKISFTITFPKKITTSCKYMPQ